MVWQRQIAPLKVYRLISGDYDDNSGHSYVPNDLIVTRSKLESRSEVEVEYIGLYKKCDSCCGGKIFVPDEDKYDHLDVVHKGGGRYGVFNKLTGEKINTGWLTKEEAEQIEQANEEEIDHEEQE